MARYIYVYICFSFHDFFLSFITMAIPLAVSVVLSILAVSVMLPSSESISTYRIVYAQMPITNAHIDKTFCLDLHLRLYCEYAISIEISSTSQYAISNNMAF